MGSEMRSIVRFLEVYGTESSSLLTVENALVSLRTEAVTTVYCRVRGAINAGSRFAHTKTTQ
jgi:hypothetical protein